MESKFANRIGHTDIEPFEVIKEIGKKTLEIRRMKAIRGFDPTFIPGGFVAHCEQETEASQEWKIEPDETESVFRVRLHKDGFYRDVGGSKYRLEEKPRKFYDYNF